ncbi:MAG: hypothetical protein HYS13_21385 [Planctomycetia bacterium]|nr:hypothetical protein [Planctomycetia bacterium]
MPEIVVDEAQAQILSQATTHVLVRDRGGNCLGYISVTPKLTPEQIAEYERRARSVGRRLTTEEVLQHLRSLESQS